MSKMENAAFHGSMLIAVFCRAHVNFLKMYWNTEILAMLLFCSNAIVCVCEMS